MNESAGFLECLISPLLLEFAVQCKLIFNILGHLVRKVPVEFLKDKNGLATLILP